MEAYMKLISLGDAKAAAAEMTNLEKFLATHTSRITSLFRYFDFDGDGLITRMDLRTGLQVDCFKFVFNVFNFLTGLKF